MIESRFSDLPGRCTSISTCSIATDSQLSMSLLLCGLAEIALLAWVKNIVCGIDVDFGPDMAQDHAPFCAGPNYFTARG